jgi:ribonuclease BN (tRNA processing enzyme)
MVEITILGSSSGDPSPDRACSSLMIDTDNHLYQFDAGEGVSASIMKNEIDHSLIRAIVISHAHSDHIAGLFLELQMMYLSGRKDSLRIYLPEESVEPVRQFMLATYLFPEKVGFEIGLHSLDEIQGMDDDLIAFYAHNNRHLEAYNEIVREGGYPNRMQSYSFAVIADERKIVYSGDVKSFHDYAPLLNDCRLLITEGYHVEIEKILMEAGKKGIDRLLLTHLRSEDYAREDAIRTMAEKYGIKGFEIASDGLKFRLS